MVRLVRQGKLSVAYLSERMIVAGAPTNSRRLPGRSNEKINRRINRSRTPLLSPFPAIEFDRCRHEIALTPSLGMSYKPPFPRVMRSKVPTAVSLYVGTVPTSQPEARPGREKTVLPPKAAQSMGCVGADEWE